MTIRTASALALLFAPWLTAQNGSIFGTVTDYADHKGMKAVVIQVELDGKAVKDPVATDKDGTYKISGLVAGNEYRVTYSKEDEGYSPDVRTVKVTSQQNPVLRKARASADYWNRAVITIQADIGKLPPDKRRDAFLQMWDELKASGVSPEGKATVAQGLRTKLPESLYSGSKTFEVYYKADRVDLRSLEDAFGSSSAPPDSRGIDPMLYEDAKTAARTYQRLHIFQLNDKSAVRAVQKPDVTTQAPKMGVTGMGDTKVVKK